MLNRNIAEKKREPGSSGSNQSQALSRGILARLPPPALPAKQCQRVLLIRALARGVEIHPVLISMRPTEFISVVTFAAGESESPLFKGGFIEPHLFLCFLHSLLACSLPLLYQVAHLCVQAVIYVNET